MADIKQLKLGDYLSDKYGRVFVVRSKTLIRHVLVASLKEVYRDEWVEQPALHMIHPYDGFGVYSRFKFNYDGYYSAYQDEESAYQGCALKDVELKEAVKGKYIVYINDLELLKPESLDFVLFEMFKEARFDDETRSGFIKRLKLVWDDGEPRTSVGFADELIGALKQANG